MIHGYGLKISGSCYSGARRFTPMDDITAYITFDNSVTNIVEPTPPPPPYMLQGGTQWRNSEVLLEEPNYDKTLSGFSYNERHIQNTVFDDFYFDLSEVNSWGTRVINGPGSPPLLAYEYYGPKFKNTLAVIPLSKHKVNPLKEGRLLYNFLNAYSGDLSNSLLVDPFEFSGVYPYAPGDSGTIQKPAGWMYSNANVSEPYFTETNFEDSGSTIDRTTADSTQLNFMPFANPLHVYDINENLIGEFDGLAFVLFYGEMALKIPFNDFPEYVGLIEGVDPLAQTIGLELNIFLAGKDVSSPRVGRIRWYLQNKKLPDGPKNNPEDNYFTTFFMKNGYSSGNYTMPMNLKIRPSQLSEGDPLSKDVKLTYSNLKVMVGA